MSEIQSTSFVYTQEPHELVEVLLQLGWTQEEIAKRVGTTQPTIHRILVRKRDPRYSIVEKLRELVLDLDELSDVGPQPSHHRGGNK